MNKAEVVSQDMKLDPGQKQSLAFQVQRSEPGEYTVAINDKSTKFVVAALPVTVLSVPPTATVVPSPAPAIANSPASPAPPPQTTPALPESSSQTPLNWLLVNVFALVGVGIVVTLAVILSRRKPMV